ncbi:acyl-CoA dehydrogenase family protein [Siccirubricoccus deserti]
MPADAGLLAGALLNAARIAGALEAVLDMTVEYANTRKQFGRAIGGFQAVQQLLARCAGRWRRPASPPPPPGARRRDAAWPAPNSRSPRPRWSAARLPAQAPRSSIRCMPPLASPMSTRCTSSPVGCGNGVTDSVRNASGPGASARRRWRGGDVLWADLTGRDER